ncbi:hypothetical protein [Nitratireductor indicus]|nr:hypothetical protein [Nitratireductor indicus]
MIPSNEGHGTALMVSLSNHEGGMKGWAQRAEPEPPDCKMP